MYELDLRKTRNQRVEWVQAQIAGIFDLEYNKDLYDTPEKWEKTISLAMSTAARGEDAKRLSSDTTEHVRKALEKLERNHLLDDLNRPFSSVGRTIFNRNMASLIVEAADETDYNLAQVKEEKFYVRTIIILLVITVILAAPLVARLFH